MVKRLRLFVVTLQIYYDNHRFYSSDGSVKVSGKLPTYPSPNPTFCLKWEVSVNVGLGEG